MIYLMIYLIIHLICAYITACSLIAYYNSYSEFLDWKSEFRLFFIIGLIGGPISLLCSFFWTKFFKYGFVWRIK
jgi:hypothetical protein